MDRIERLPAVAGIDLVHLPSDLHHHPVLTLHVDADRRVRADRDAGAPLLAVRDRVDVLSDDTYAWVGTVRLNPDGSDADRVLGDVTLIHRKNEGVTGSVQIKGEVFQIRALERGLHALIAFDENQFKGGEGDGPESESGRKEAARSAPQPMPPPTGSPSGAATGDDQDRVISTPHVRTGISVATKAASARCTPDLVRALVVYTASAESNDPDIYGTVLLAVQQTNDAYHRSAIDDYGIRLAHAQEVSFAETGNSEVDVNALQQNTAIRALRDQHDADVVVLLTGFGDAGRAKEIYASADNAYAVARYDWATSIYTFAHEVGHLQGARHHPDDDERACGGTGCPDLGFPYGRGHRFSDGWWLWRDDYATVMAYNIDSYDRIKRFSNPDVRYDGRSTGTSTRDNARVLRETAEYVSDFRDPNELRASILTVFPDVPEGARYTFHAQPCGGNGSYSYAWRISYGDPFNYGTVQSTQPSFSTVVPEGDTYVELTVRAGGGEPVAVRKHVYRRELVPLPDPGLARVDGPEITDSPQQLVALTLHPAHPNPFTAATELAFDLPEATDVTLVVYDVLGREVARVAEGPHPAGSHRARLDAAGLPTGTYIVRLTTGARVQTQRVSLVK